MSFEVRVDEHFLLEHLGNALAKLWTVNRLTLALSGPIEAISTSK